MSARDVGTPCDLGNALFDEVFPWGWDPALRQRLLSLGVPERLLPSNEFLDILRRLSHRRISIACNEFLGSPSVPAEFFSVEEALGFALSSPGCYFKMPWSSGGRGVVATADLSQSQIREWLIGCLRRQGSVLAERGVDRNLDFASLWSISEQGQVRFEGMSVSECDGRGKYKGNLSASQDLISRYILSKAPSFTSDIIEAQRDFIAAEIAPFYHGKLGIDMMADTDGVVYPCVEINLRITMGHVALNWHELPKARKAGLPLNNLPLLEKI